MGYVLTVPSVLVTGAGRGIGRATALRLAASGWEVIAGVRRTDDGEALVRAYPDQITPVTLDITHGDQVAALDQSLPARLDGLVNNAGVVVAGPVETVPLSELRRQLEVKRRGAGGGDPGRAATAARAARAPGLRLVGQRACGDADVRSIQRKFALEGMADALRMEVSPWSVRVALVEPAQTDTDLWREADGDLDDAVALLSPAHRELYAQHIAGFRQTIPRSQRMAAPADGRARHAAPYGYGHPPPPLAALLR